MARIRTIKPELFQHSDLFDIEQETGLPLRLAWIGLFTCCDREGRFKWRPRELKLQVLPYDEVDFSRVLDALASRGFLVRYASQDEIYGCIPSWSKHQYVNNKESQSSIPPPLQNQSLDARFTRESRDVDATITRGVKERKGKEGEGERKDGPTVEEIILAHPTAKSRGMTAFAIPRSWCAAAVDALASGETREGLLAKVEAIAGIVMQWPPGERKFLKSVDRFFREHEFNKPLTEWRENGTPKSMGRTEGNLEALRIADELDLADQEAARHSGRSTAGQGHA